MQNRFQRSPTGVSGSSILQPTRLNIPSLQIRFLSLATLLCFFHPVVFGQHPQQVIDSLRISLRSAKADTVKVNLYNDLSWQLKKISEFDNAGFCADSALVLSHKLNYDRGKARAYHHLGIIETDKGNFAEGLKNQQKALALYEKLGHQQGIAYSCNSISRIYEYQGNYPEALKYNSRFIKIVEEIGDKRGIAGGYRDIGMMHFYQGNYPASLEAQLKALKIYQEIDEKMGISIMYGNIALIYNDQGRYNEALETNLAALVIQEEIGDRVGIAYSYGNIGTIYHNQDKMAESLESHLKALKIQEEIGDLWGSSLSYNNLGSLYSKKGNYPEALRNHLKSLEIAKELGDKEGISSVHIDIGKVLAKEAATVKDSVSKLKYQEAIDNLNAGLSIAKEIGSRASTYDAYEALAFTYQGLQDYKQALDYHSLFIALKDSLINNENTQQLEQLRTQYEVEKAVSEEKVQRDILLTEQKFLSKRALDHKNTLHELALAEARAQQEKNLEVEKIRYEYTIAEERTQTERKQDQLVLLNKEREIQKLEIKKQTMLKNYLLGGLALLGLLFFFVYKNYNTRQQLKLQTLRNKIASDLHDDVGSTLSSISIFSQLAQQQSKETIPILQTIEESSRKMLDAMADIVWTINPENDQFEKILLRMRNFAFEILGAKNIDFEFIAGEDVSRLKLPMEVRKNLYLIFKEATNNMVKYAHADKAMISIKEEKNILSMLIRDNGNGFDINKSTEGNGIRNMRKRASEIGAKLLIDSSPEDGTKIELRIAV